jgi:hypothetical protein
VLQPGLKLRHPHQSLLQQARQLRNPRSQHVIRRGRRRVGGTDYQRTRQQPPHWKINDSTYPVTLAIPPMGGILWSDGLYSVLVYYAGVIVLRVSEPAEPVVGVEKAPTAKHCKWCETAPIKWMPVRGGQRRPFDYQLVKRDEAANSGWAPFRDRQTGEVFLRPTSEISDHKLSSATWVATQHFCAQYEDAKLKLQTSGAWDSWAQGLLMSQEAFRRARQRRRSEARQNSFDQWQARRQEMGERFVDEQKREREVRRDRFAAQQKRDRDMPRSTEAENHE